MTGTPAELKDSIKVLFPLAGCCAKLLSVFCPVSMSCPNWFRTFFSCSQDHRCSRVSELSDTVTTKMMFQSFVQGNKGRREFSKMLRGQVQPFKLQAEEVSFPAGDFSLMDVFKRQVDRFELAGWGIAAVSPDNFVRISGGPVTCDRGHPAFLSPTSCSDNTAELTGFADALR